MKIIKNRVKNEIDLRDVNKKHIIIIQYGGAWCVVQKENYDNEKYVAVVLEDQTEDIQSFTVRNTYTHVESLDNWIKKSEEAYAFYTFKEACEFLITVL